MHRICKTICSNKLRKYSFHFNYMVNYMNCCYYAESSVPSSCLNLISPALHMEFCSVYLTEHNHIIPYTLATANQLYAKECTWNVWLSYFIKLKAIHGVWMIDVLNGIAWIWLNNVCL